MTDSRRPTVASSTLGAIGRFGNQVLQYGFLRLYAERHGLALETPPWIGRELFACCEPPVTPGRAVLTELELGVFEAGFESREPAEGVDLWGWFQVDTATLARQQRLFRETPPAAPGDRRTPRSGSGSPVCRWPHPDRLSTCGAAIFSRRWGHPLVDRCYVTTPMAQYREWLEGLGPPSSARSSSWRATRRWTLARSSEPSSTKPRARPGTADLTARGRKQGPPAPGR